MKLLKIEMLCESNLPSKSTKGSAGFDIHMPSDGIVYHSARKAIKVPLGFKTEIPEGYSAIIMPRSGVGAKEGLALNNTIGLIDSDYRGEWVAFLRLNDEGQNFTWKENERILQFFLVKTPNIEVELVDSISDTDRGEGGFGSTSTNPSE